MSSAGQSSQDVVGVFDSDFNQLFPNARSVRALVAEKSKAATMPIEDGGTIGDNVIDLPTLIDLNVILNAADYQDTYQQIKAAKAARNLVSVLTKVDTYQNMLILECPHDEVPEMADTIAMNIKLLEFILVAAQYAQIPATQVKKKSNASTVKTGQKTAAPASTAQSSAFYDFVYGSGQ